MLLEKSIILISKSGCGKQYQLNKRFRTKNISKNFPQYETLLSSQDEGVRFSSAAHSTEDKGDLQG
jgi:hypothetical protein